MIYSNVVSKKEEELMSIKLFARTKLVLIELLELSQRRKNEKQVKNFEDIITNFDSLSDDNKIGIAESLSKFNKRWN